MNIHKRKRIDSLSDDSLVVFDTECDTLSRELSGIAAGGQSFYSPASDIATASVSHYEISRLLRCTYPRGQLRPFGSGDTATRIYSLI